MVANMVYQYVKVNIKKILQYRTDFLIGILPHLVGQIANLVFFKIILGSVASIQGWEMNELMLMFGFSTLVFGVYYLLFGNFRSLKSFLFNGQFEVMRIRPIRLISHIMVISFRSEAIEQVLLGVILLAYTCSKIAVGVSFLFVIAVLYFVVCGTAILGGLTLFSSSFLFLTQGTFSPIGIISELREYTKYPIDIFGHALQFVFTWLIPIGFVSYYPSIFILGRQSSAYVFAGLIALASFLIGYVSFHFGLRFYNGVSV